MVFEAEYRTIRARDYYLSDEELYKFQIRRVYNMSGIVSAMPDSMIREDMLRVVRSGRGEVCLVEFAIRGDGGYRYRLKVASIIVFRSLACLNMFVLANQELYGEVGVMNVIMN